MWARVGASMIELEPLQSAFIDYISKMIYV